jgi:hypothetical protein
MKEFKADTDDQMRSAFAAFALQGLLTCVDPDFLDDPESKRFLVETSWELAEMMMGQRNAATRH